MDVADLRAKLGLDSSAFDSGISNVLGRMNPIGGAALGVSAIATGAVAAIGYAAYKVGEEFDTAYDSIRIGTGATGAKLDGLKGSFKDVVTDVPASFGDASAAITGLNQRLGATGPRLRDLSDQFLELSRITGTDVAEDVRLGTRLFGDWSIKTGKQAEALDQLYRATQKSDIGLSDLMATVVQFGAPLRNMGFSFGDSVAMLAKWEKEGVNTSTVLTGMKFALKTFAAAGKEPQAALAAITAKIHDTNNAQTAMTLGMKTFGLRAGPDMVAAIREGRFQYAKFAETIANGRDTIHTAAKDTEDLAESWTKMVNALKVKIEPGASDLFGFIGNLASDMPRDQVIANYKAIEAAADDARTAMSRKWTVKPGANGLLDFGKAAEGNKDSDQGIKRSKALIEDYDKLLKKPRILGPLNVKNTQGQLKNIEDDVMHFLHISKEEADQVMAQFFDNFKPKKGLVEPTEEAADQVKARIKKMRAELARNILFGHLNNGPLLAKIKAAEAEQKRLRDQLKQSIAVGSLNTSGWIGPIRAAEQEMHNLRTLVGAGMYAPPIVIDIIKPNVPKLATGGVFTRPTLGIFGEAGPEAIIPLTNPRRRDQVMQQAGLSGAGGGTVINNNVSVNGTVYGVDDLHSAVYAGTMAAMEEAQVAEGRSARGSVR